MMDFKVDKWLYALEHLSLRYFVFAGMAFLIFYVLFAKQFKPIKIQETFPKQKDYNRDVAFSVLSILIFATVAYITFTALKPYNNIYYGAIDHYGMLWYALSFVWMFFLHDAYFYWAHRIMHHPAIFKQVHLVHHKSTNPSPWTAYAFHPMEAIVEAGIAPVIAFTLPVHSSAFIIFMLFQIIYNVYGHLGYELYPSGFAKTKIGRWVNTSTAHNQHHKYFKGNYGLYTLIWDRWMGTLRSDYEENFRPDKK